MKARIQKLMGQAFFQQGDFEKSLSHFVKVRRFLSDKGILHAKKFMSIEILFVVQ